MEALKQGESKKGCGERDYSVQASSFKRGTLLSGGVEVPSYDIRGGGRSLGEESPGPHLVSQSKDYLITERTYLKTYLFRIE